MLERRGATHRPLPPHLDLRGLRRLGPRHRRAVHRGEPVPAPHPYNASKAGRPCGAAYFETSPYRDDHQLLQQLRALPVPERSSHCSRPRPRRRAPPAVRLDAERREWLHVVTTAGHRSRARARRWGRPTTWAAVSRPASKRSRPGPGRPRKPSSLKKIVPDRPGTTALSPRLHQDPHRARMDAEVPSRGLAETVAWYAEHRGCGSRCATAPRWSRPAGPKALTVAPAQAGHRPKGRSHASTDHRSRRTARHDVAVAFAASPPGEAARPVRPAAPQRPTSRWSPPPTPSSRSTTEPECSRRCSGCGPTCGPCRRLHGGRRLRERPGHRVRRQRLGTRHVAEAAARSAPTSCTSRPTTSSTHRRQALRRVGRHKPLSVYGRSKLGGEQECRVGRRSCAHHGSAGRLGTTWSRRRCASGQGPAAALRRRPAWLPDLHRRLAAAVVTLARTVARHVPRHQPGATTWFGFVAAVLEASAATPAGSSRSRRPNWTARPAPRPANSVLDNAALRLNDLPLLPDWRDGLAAWWHLETARADERHDDGGDAKRVA